jgi:protein phosphatase
MNPSSTRAKGTAATRTDAGTDRFSPRECPQAGECLLGGVSGNMLASTLAFRFPLGARGLAGSDPAMGKQPNEDAAVVVPLENFAAVLDGVGGYWGGDKAARFLSAGLLQHPADWPKAIEFARAEMTALPFEDALKLYGSSACFAGMRIFQLGKSRFACIGLCGDCRMVLLRADGTILQTRDESYVMELIQQGVIQADEALYNEFRNRISNAIRLAFPSAITVNPPLMVNGIPDGLSSPVELRAGDRLVLMSDGLSDNLTPGEIQSLTAGLELNEAYLALVSTVQKRMRDSDGIVLQMIRSFLQATQPVHEKGVLDRLLAKIQASGPYTWLFHTIFQKARAHYKVFPDGFLSKPARDNLSLILIEVDPWP